MRSIIFIISLFLFQNFYSQEKTYSLTAVDTAPIIGTCDNFKDTKECFTFWLIDHIKRNTDVSKTHSSPGRAYVQFVVSATGEIKDVKVRAKNEAQIKEATRVVSGLKFMQPASLNGENVAIVHSVPVVFQTEIYNSRKDYLKTKTKEIEAELDQEKSKNR